MTWPTGLPAGNNPPYTAATPVASYSVLDGTTLIKTVSVNQQQAPNDLTDAGASWEDLGGLVQLSGSTLVVRLPGPTVAGMASADAVRVEKVGELPSAVQLLDPSG